jgi:hypothetical protein
MSSSSPPPSRRRSMWACSTPHAGAATAPFSAFYILTFTLTHIQLVFYVKKCLENPCLDISSFLIILSSCNFIHAIAILPLRGNNMEIIRHIFMRRFTLLLLLHSRFLLSHVGQCRCVWVGSCCIQNGCLSHSQEIHCLVLLKSTLYLFRKNIIALQWNLKK